MDLFDLQYLAMIMTRVYLCKDYSMNSMDTSRVLISCTYKTISQISYRSCDKNILGHALILIDMCEPVCLTIGPGFRLVFVLPC